MAITIISAVWGTKKAGVDVTKICQESVNTGNDDIPATNEFFGKDPDPGAQKSFAIFYQNPAMNNGNPIALGCAEGVTLDLVPRPQTANTPPVPAPIFTIIHAMWGTAKNGLNSTANCQSLISKGGSTIPATNDAMGGDPDVGLQKRLAVVYTKVGGSTEYYLACAEGETLDLKAGVL